MSKSQTFRPASSPRPIAQDDAALDTTQPDLQGSFGHKSALRGQNSYGNAFVKQALASSGGGRKDDEQVQQIAAAGTEGGGTHLPFFDAIQTSFGHHDISGIRAHQGDEAGQAAQSIGAQAFAMGSDVALHGVVDLHTSAHEAAHVIQQRGGVQLAGGIGREGDPHEVHADAVADRVVRGESAESLLDQRADPSAGEASATSVQSQNSQTIGQLKDRSRWGSMRQTSDGGEIYEQDDRSHTEENQDFMEEQEGLTDLQHNKLSRTLANAFTVTSPSMMSDPDWDVITALCSQIHTDIAMVLAADITQAVRTRLAPVLDLACTTASFARGAGTSEEGVRKAVGAMLIDAEVALSVPVEQGIWLDNRGNVRVKTQGELDELIANSRAAASQEASWFSEFYPFPYPILGTEHIIRDREGEALFRKRYRPLSEGFQGQGHSIIAMSKDIWDTGGGTRGMNLEELRGDVAKLLQKSDSFIEMNTYTQTSYEGNEGKHAQDLMTSSKIREHLFPVRMRHQQALAMLDGQRHENPIGSLYYHVMDIRSALSGTLAIRPFRTDHDSFKDDPIRKANEEESRDIPATGGV